MISQDSLHSAVNAAVKQIISEQGNLEPAPVPPVPPVEPAEKVKVIPEDRIIPFDEVDSLRVANYLLRIQNERLLREVEERRRKLTKLELDDVDEGIHNILAAKYEIDLEEFDISLDPQEKKLTVSAKL